MLTFPFEKPLRCAGKTAHETPKAAGAELKKRKHAKMKVYKCGFCGKYHIGHTRTNYNYRKKLAKEKA